MIIRSSIETFELDEGEEEELPVKGGGGKDVAEDADANFLHRSSPIRNKGLLR